MDLTPDDCERVFNLHKVLILYAKRRVKVVEPSPISTRTMAEQSNKGSPRREQGYGQASVL
jgi:hypothetical protein